MTSPAMIASIRRPMPGENVRADGDARIGERESGSTT